MISRAVLLVSAAILLSFALSGCQKSRTLLEVDSTVRARLDHEGFERTCVGCHEKRRPASPHPAAGDCVNCHTPGTEWLDLKYFKHTPPPQSCVRCHEEDRPVTSLFKLFLKHGSGADCANCHNPGTQWNDTQEFSHVPVPESCAVCHEKKRPVDVSLPPPNSGSAPHFPERDCSECHRPRAEKGLPFIFDHRNSAGKVIASCLPCHEAARKTEDHFPEKDCMGCHLDPSKPWKLSIGSPHPANDPAPQSCSSCHTGWRPADHYGEQDCIGCHKPASTTVTAFLFDHAASGASIRTCLPCHESDRPSLLVNDHFLHSVGGSGDCANCHTRPGEQWAGGLFSHEPAPASCAECHSSKRPTAVVNRFDHTASGADCSNCHKRPGFTWSEATYGHSPKPTQCVNCHSTDRPASVVNGFDHARVQAADCAGCHQQPGITWSGGSYSHQPAPTACSACHASDRPAARVGTTNFSHTDQGCGGYRDSGGRWHGCHGQYHSYADCFRCHTGAPGVSWSIPDTGVIDHSCGECHSAGM